MKPAGQRIIFKGDLMPLAVVEKHRSWSPEDPVYRAKGDYTFKAVINW